MLIFSQFVNLVINYLAMYILIFTVSTILTAQKETVVFKDYKYRISKKYKPTVSADKLDMKDEKNKILIETKIVDTEFSKMETVADKTPSLLTTMFQNYMGAQNLTLGSVEKKTIADKSVIIMDCTQGAISGYLAYYEMPDGKTEITVIAKEDSNIGEEELETIFKNIFDVKMTNE